MKPESVVTTKLIKGGEPYSVIRMRPDTHNGFFFIAGSPIMASIGQIDLLNIADADVKKIQNGDVKVLSKYVKRVEGTDRYEIPQGAKTVGLMPRQVFITGLLEINPVDENETVEVISTRT